MQSWLMRLLFERGRVVLFRVVALLTLLVLQDLARTHSWDCKDYHRKWWQSG